MLCELSARVSMDGLLPNMLYCVRTRAIIDLQEKKHFLYLKIACSAIGSIIPKEHATSIATCTSSNNEEAFR